MPDTVYRAKLSDIRQLKRNPNKGSLRGQYMLEKSFEDGGAGRSILLAADGSILAGNHASEVYGQVSGNEEVLVIETDGKTLVAVKRTDIPDEDDPRAKLLIIADNRSSDVHEYDADVVAELLAENEELVKAFWREDELAELIPQGVGSKANTRNVKMALCPHCGMEFRLHGA